VVIKRLCVYVQRHVSMLIDDTVLYTAVDFISYIRIAVDGPNEC
jgi:hypothetical protein